MTGAWGFISTVIKGMGEEQGMTYLRALAKQDIVPLPIAIRAVLDRVIGGEYAIGLEMNNTHAAISAAQGAPVQWVPLNPVSETIQAAGITKGAPHPNAARLFIDFMVSRTGQEIFRDNDYLPMHPDINAKIPELRPSREAIGRSCTGRRTSIAIPRAGQRFTRTSSADVRRGSRCRQHLRPLQKVAYSLRIRPIQKARRGREEACSCGATALSFSPSPWRRRWR